MVATPYRVYMVFKHTEIEGKYIPLLYTASDVVGANLVLPSDSTTYTIPAGIVPKKKQNIGWRRLWSLAHSQTQTTPKCGLTINRPNT